MGILRRRRPPEAVETVTATFVFTLGNDLAKVFFKPDHKEFLITSGSQKQYIRLETESRKSLEPQTEYLLQLPKGEECEFLEPGSDPRLVVIFDGERLERKGRSIHAKLGKIKKDTRFEFKLLYE
ncbi:MAG: hypothetical protein QF775_00925 [archaeon]|nr:hypothetical protein [Euryarchaeota archaeon]MDP6704030.1 hypothetical protein [archaeon]|tara:strand:- start:9821 stop:10195 length:375 start_codon:yes stop_codon:yes gene_type:complete